MGWAAGVFGEGGVVLAFGCLVGMGLLMWLLLRLTGDSSARVDVQRPHGHLAGQRSAGSAHANGQAPAPLNIDEHPPSVPGTGSVAP
jgi:hypothetical protein